MTTTPEGESTFLAYRANGWGRHDPTLRANDCLKDIDQAIRRARELGCERDADRLERLKHGGR